MSTSSDALTFLPDHEIRLARARRSLDGLSIGDAFCAQFFIGEVYHRHIAPRSAPPGTWGYTDDTEMALGIFENLTRFGRIEQYDLASTFARRYMAEMYRGYGPAAHGILKAIYEGTPWRNVSYGVFGGSGSFGNGGAMRVGPVGAYFADDLDRVVIEADRSAEVTHAHSEGRAGAIATALAAAVAFSKTPGEGELLRAAIERTPPSKTREGIEAALHLGPAVEVQHVARVLGNGARVTSQDTLPLALWLADRYRDDFPQAMWATISAGGDIDTIGAIVGGVVAGCAASTIPPSWLSAREPLQITVAG